MSASVATEIKQEVAKSLLERLREKTALVKFFRYNASAKHGVPVDPEKEISFQTSAIEEKLPVAQRLPESVPVTNPVQIYTNQPTTTTNGTLKGVLATIAVLAGAAGTGLLGWVLGNKEPVPQESTKQVIQQSPYQFLEDMGEHWP